MAPPPSRSASRYRRRVLLIGGAFALLLYVIGAPIFNGRIEDDLERRVPDELAEAGFDGVLASFSGQDGTLRCDQPLDDPEAAVDAAFDVWGVRAIELDRSCRVNRAPTIETTTTTAVADDAAGDDATDPEPSEDDVLGDDVAEEPVATTAPATTTTTVPEPDFDTIVEIIASSPELSLLAVLGEEAAIGDVVAGEDEVTLFAPTDAAFDALPADVIARLRSEPELLRRVLVHHAIAGAVVSEELTSGAVETLDGGSVEIVVTDAAITIDDATVTAADIVAANGIVHVIDRVLVPADVDLSPPAPQAEVAARFADGGVVLEGVVATEVVRAVLADAATAGVGAAGVVDQLTVDPDSGLDLATAESLGGLVTAMVGNLLSGVAGFDGTALYVTGAYLTEADRDAMLAAAEAASVEADLMPRPEATEEDAVDLEAELNEFVAANPILFEQSSATLTPASDAVLDGIVQRVQQFGGVSITIEGHTDSDGVPIENVVLSQLRALAVRDALIARGLDEATLTAEGFGSERPILVDGVEDKAASRRVEFRVVTEP